jgi:DNA-binding beta-propeller fold protein YncE
MHLYFSSPEMRFLARGLAGDDLRVDQIPVREQGHRDGLFLVAPALPEALARLRAVYPHGQLREHRDLHSALLFTSYRVSAADLNAAAGYDAPWRQYDLSFGMGGSRFGQFQNGRGLAVDPLGRTYIADTGNGRIDVFDPAGKPIETVGKRGDGDAEFHTVWSVAVAPDGTVLGLDRETCWLKRFTPAGRWLGNFGGPALLQQPSGVAVGADGTVFVADSARHVIMRFDLHGQLLGPLGSRGSGPGEFEEPSAVAVAADGTVYVADAGNGRVQRFSQTLEYVAEWAVPRAQPDLGPALAVANDDSAAVYLVNPARVTVDRYSSGGRREWSVGEQGNAPGQLALPVAVAVDAHGSVYVLDNFRNQVYRFDVTRRPR